MSVFINKLQPSEDLAFFILKLLRLKFGMGQLPLKMTRAASLCNISFLEMGMVFITF